MTGQQALDILGSDELAAFREKQGGDIPVFVEGRVGLIEASDGGTLGYINQLKEAGAMGAVVGGGLVPNEAGQTPLESLLCN